MVDKIKSLSPFLKNMSFKYYDSILLRLEYVKLYDRFRVFYPNHLITDRAKYNPNPKLFIGEVFIPDNYYEIVEFIKDEFIWYEKYMAHHVVKTQKVIEKIHKYLIKGLLALVYKFLKGVQVNISILLGIDEIEDIKEAIDEVVDILTTKFTQFERLFIAQKSKGFDSSKKRKNSTVHKLNAFKEIEKRDKTYYEYKEEKPYDVFVVLRKLLDRGIFIIKEVFNNDDYSYLISRYKRARKIPNRTQYMKSNLNSSLTLENRLSNNKNENSNTEKLENSQKSELFKTLFKPLKSR